MNVGRVITGDDDRIIVARCCVWVEIEDLLSSNKLDGGDALGDGVFGRLDGGELEEGSCSGSRGRKKLRRGVTL